MKPEVVKTRLKQMIVAAVVVSGCSVVTEEKKPVQPQNIEFGLMAVDSEMVAQGTMVPWDNTATFYPLKAQWTHGIEFSFDLQVDQSVYLFLDSDQNFDCNAGATLMGPSYYLKFADGSEIAFDYETRATVQKFPGKGDPDFPGLVPIGSHRLIARWFSNEECRMDIAVAAKDRFAPKNNAGPFIQRADLLGSWSKDDRTYDYSMSGILTVKDGSDTAATLDVVDFPYHGRYSATVKAVEGSASGFAVGEIYYCAYDIADDNGKSQLTLGCNEPGNTSVPDTAKNPVVFSR